MRKGFTLVELSIVLVIIGLLIGGVLIGQSLIKSAQNMAMIKKIEQVHILVKQFKDVYQYIPGDLPNAYQLFGGLCGSNRVPSTHVFSSQRCNGTGNGYIGWGNNNLEVYIFWEHLYLAGFLETPYDGIGYAVGHNSAEGIPGTNMMEMQDRVGQFQGYPGGLAASQQNIGSDIAYSLMLGAPTTGGCSPMCDGLLDATDALAYDAKIDDGDASTGLIVSGGYGFQCHSGGTYSVNISETSCKVYSRPPEYLR